MNDQILKGIKQSLTNEEITSIRITRALRALEVDCYLVAVQACDLALTSSEWIEQKLAIMAIKEIALKKNKEATKQFLQQIYGIEGDR